MKCDFYATCVPLDNGEHICDCPRICPANYSPVCASNNVTYDNECQMKVASCEIQEMLFVQSPGQCSGMYCVYYFVGKSVEMVKVRRVKQMIVAYI